jgi:3-oxoadipate enol-lactonase
MPKIQANGIDLYYQLHGPEDADVLVLSNGVLMSTAGWAYQVPVLSRYSRLLLYDCRGMWQSDHPPGPYTMELHAEDLAALLDELGIKDAHISGSSYGAEISMVFALQYPERTRSLIVTSAVSQVDPVLRGLIDAWVAAAEAKDSDLFFEQVYPVVFSDDWRSANQPILDQARERYRTLNFDSLIELLRCFLSFNITSELKKINAPTLVVAGEKDRLKLPSSSELIASKIPGAEFAVIPNAGHAIMWERAELFNTLLLGFVTKHGSHSG